MWEQNPLCDLCFLISIPTFTHTTSLPFPPSLEQHFYLSLHRHSIHIQNSIIGLAGDNNEKFMKFLFKVLEKILLGPCPISLTPSLSSPASGTTRHDDSSSPPVYTSLCFWPQIVIFSITGAHPTSIWADEKCQGFNVPKGNLNQ